MTILYIQWLFVQHLLVKAESFLLNDLDRRMINISGEARESDFLSTNFSVDARLLCSFFAEIVCMERVLQLLDVCINF